MFIPPSPRRPTPFPFSRDFNLYACHAALQYTRINNSNLFRSLWYKSVGKTRDSEKRRRSTPNEISTWFENLPKSWQYVFPVFFFFAFKDIAVSLSMYDSSGLISSYLLSFCLFPLFISLIRLVLLIVFCCKYLNRRYCT